MPQVQILFTDGATVHLGDAQTSTWLKRFGREVKNGVHRDHGVPIVILMERVHAFDVKNRLKLEIYFG